MMKLSLLLTVAVCFSVSSVKASLITLNLLDAGGSAGESFEDTGTFTTNGVTFTIGVTTTLGDGTGSYSANTTTAGINSDGISGATDLASEFDLGESLSITLSFAATTTVSLDNIDFSGVGSSAADAANATTPSGSVQLFTGATDFNGSSDIWTPSGGIPFSSGDSVVFSATDQMALQSISFNITAIPEPGSITLLSVIGAIAGFLFYRKRLN